MFLPDPVSVLRSVSRHIKSVGVGSDWDFYSGILPITTRNGGVVFFLKREERFFVQICTCTVGNRAVSGINPRSKDVTGPAQICALISRPTSMMERFCLSAV